MRDAGVYLLRSEPQGGGQSEKGGQRGQSIDHVPCPAVDPVAQQWIEAERTVSGRPRL